MGNKAGKWQQHLKAAEASGLTLVAYAAQHRIDVRRLYEARRARVQAATGITGKQHPVAFALVKVVTPTAPKSPNPTGAKLTMQARLGVVGVVARCCTAWRRCLVSPDPDPASAARFCHVSSEPEPGTAWRRCRVRVQMKHGGLPAP